MNNIKKEILEVVDTIPEGVSPLEKVRWIYIKLGKLFSFTYNKDIVDPNVSILSDYINKYETCTEISNILNEILNNIDPSIKCEVIDRKNPNRIYTTEHNCNVITYEHDGLEEKYLLDLTLDLYRIQFGLTTNEFGLCGYEGLDLDILPKMDAKKMDINLGLIEEEYNDKKIEDIKRTLSFTDFSNMSFEEEINYRMQKVIPFLELSNTFSELNEFLYHIVLDNFFKCQIIRSIIRKDDKVSYLYVFRKNGMAVWYIFDENNKFYKTNPDNVKTMLDNGWSNTRGVINKMLTQSEKKL